MAHKQQLKFITRIRDAFPSYFQDVKTLEIGSLDINGTTREFFQGGSYLGLDVAEGPGVDVVCQGQDYDAPDGSYDTVISCEVMEHNPHWKETMRNMIRLCRPGGIVIMTCASTGRPEHGTTRTTPGNSPLTVGIGWEYYRNLTAHDFCQALDLPSLLDPFGFMSNSVSHDLYFVGFKRGGTPPPAAAAAIARLRHRYIINNGLSIFNGLSMFRFGNLKKQLLIGLVGKERYYAGPVRPRWRKPPGA